MLNLIIIIIIIIIIIVIKKKCPTQPNLIHVDWVGLG